MALGAHDDEVGAAAARHPEDSLDRVAPARDDLDDARPRVEGGDAALGGGVALGERFPASGRRRLGEKCRVGAGAAEERVRRHGEDR